MMISWSSKHSGQGWKDIPDRDLDSWNQRLLQTDGSLYQYPFWNEPFRRMHFSPRYLLYASQERFVAYICILTIGGMGFRIGLVQRGPVSLIPNDSVPLRALEDLYTWGKREGFLFMRFSHSKPEDLALISSLGESDHFDAFPFYRDQSEELIVEQIEDDREMLAGFQEVARRNIKKGRQTGYQVQISDSPDTFRKAWPVFQRLSKRKGFRYRPLISYLDLFRLARPHQCVRLYMATIENELVEAILTVRDRVTSVYMSGALDVNALQDRPSPSCYLHWFAMRDLFRQGVRYYNLGTRSGSVYQFKRKFRPLERTMPTPITLVFSPHCYNLWSTVILRTTCSIWPLTRRILFR